ncbi:cation:proton antiporter [Helcococcus kunzii]|uniref:cation:proton antiporter n=1 Tax=Helcococcus kunzii TaxID=40091 RepID=UPI0038ACE0F9
MIFSFGIIFLLGLIFSKIFEKIKLPRLLGMLIVGIIIGPYVLNLIDTSVLNISTELRILALVIILLRAGISLDLNKIIENGRPALLLSFLPATFEIVAYTFFAKWIFQIDFLSAAIMGTILSAVSPAVVVPSMLKVIDSGYGNKKGIGQMILAGASLDDAFVLTIFSILLNLSKDAQISVMSFASIFISIFSAIALAFIIGKLISKILKWISNNLYFDLLMLISISLIFVGLKNQINNIIPFSEMLFVLSFGLFYSLSSEEENILAQKNSLNGLWYGFEIILFVMIGAAIDIRYTLDSGVLGILLIFLTLMVRIVGVYISLLGTKLNIKEKIFIMISYIPKATIQATIGGIPLAMGLANGKLILSMAVLGIIVTAPLGAIGIENTYKKLLEK